MKHASPLSKLRSGITTRSLVACLALTSACDDPAVDAPSDAGSGWVDAASLALPTDLCSMPLSPNEPLCNRHAANSAWAMSHRTSYAQGSSGWPAPAAGTEVKVEHLTALGIPVVLGFTGPYEDGQRAIWATLLGLDSSIVKVDVEGFEVIDTYVPAEREDDPPEVPLGVSGAYTLVDTDNRFIVGRARFVSFFEDATPGDRSSKIRLASRTDLPASWFCTEDDSIAGMVLTYDGSLAIATEQGALIVMPRDGAELTEDSAARVSINGDRCGESDETDLEIVSNSLAADENGGIYVVTSRAMYRYDYDGSSLTRAWRAAYDTTDMPSPIRLGPGSGSTPSLMGTAPDEDRFVVITDGQELMHLVFMWRDEIPEGWEPIAPGKSRRIACEVPIDFGEKGAIRSSSEQSVMVHGHAAVVVNNLVKDPPSASLPVIQNLATAITSGIPSQAPHGLERVDWNAAKQRCDKVWVNAEASVPNGIPTMSPTSGLVYGIGRRNGNWGLLGLDFDTGKRRLWAAATTDCSTLSREGFDFTLNFPAVSSALDGEPQYCENSLYAGTTVGPDGAVYTGTLGGISRYVPDEVAQLPVSQRIDAGLEQVRWLLVRAVRDGVEGRDASEPGRVGTLESAQRAALQLQAVLDLAAEGSNYAKLRVLQATLASAIEELEAGQSPAEVFNLDRALWQLAGL